MKHKIIFAVVVFSLLGVMVFGTFGCATAPETTPIATFVTTDTFNAKMSEMQAQINQKAEQSALTAQATRIDGLASQSSANSYSKTETYTKAEVNAQIAAVIAALKAEANPWGSTSSGGTTGDYGELVDSDGDLELWLDRVSGIATDELRTTLANDQMARFDFVVVNKDADSAHDFKINLMFYPNTNVTLDMIDATHKTRVTASGSLTYTVSRDQITPIAPNTNPLSFYQSNTGRVLKGDAEDYTIWLYVSQDTAASVDWDWTITIDDRD